MRFFAYSLNDSVEMLRKQLTVPWKSSDYSYFVAGALYPDYLVGFSEPAGTYWETPIRPWSALYIKFRDALSTDSTEFKAFTETPKSFITVKIDDNKSYFGWIRVSTSNDGKSITIYDAAISKLPNTPIKADEK